MNECCAKRKNTIFMGQAKEDESIKEMMCRVCKTAWRELVNPDAGPKLLEACKLLLWEINGNHLDVDRSALKTAINAMKLAEVSQ